jgi:excisionase family DNA binding protein
MTAQKMVTLAAAAELYGITEKTLRRRISDGLLPAYRVGPRLIRVKPSDVEKLFTRIPTAQ